MESDTMRQRFVQSNGEEQSKQGTFETKSSSRQSMFLIKALTCFFCGAIFGFVAEKGQGEIAIQF